jgi:hypothetical protein
VVLRQLNMGSDLGLKFIVTLTLHAFLRRDMQSSHPLTDRIFVTFFSLSKLIPI